MKELQPTTASANNLFTEDKEIHKFTLGPQLNPKIIILSQRNVIIDNPDCCRFKLEKCHARGKQGHIAKLFQSRKKLQSPKNDSTFRATHQVVELSKSTSVLVQFVTNWLLRWQSITNYGAIRRSFLCYGGGHGAAVSLINKTTYQLSSRNSLSNC